ncbi:hypothetical protein MPSEU_000111400 [Mayamaea pseudoterrestris]|nr:hypothetical protein MPSEU_000111400 [Mayamaea pseudoterrestris]
MTSLRRRNNAQHGQAWLGLDESSVHSSGSSSYYDCLQDGKGKHRTSKATWGNLRLPAFSHRTRLVLGVILTILPWMYHSSLANQLKKLQKKVAGTQQSQRRLASDLLKAKKELQVVSSEQSQLEARNNELLEHLHADAVETESAAYLENKIMEDKYLLRISEIETALTKKAASISTSKHGNGPYHVAVTLTEEPVPGVGKSFMVETLPNMPLSTGHFLQLVDRKYYDGQMLLHQQHGANVVSSFIENAEATFFADPELKHLPFVEHNDAQHRIQKYSVLFQGKPGGPNFYVFMDSKYTPMDQLDETCFGKVIQGQGVLDAMVAPKSDGERKLDKFAIESVRVLAQHD